MSASKDTVDRIKQECVRNRVTMLDVLAKTGGGHFGGSLSAMDIMTTLYNGVMNIDPANPRGDNRDYFILSKGHANAGFATVLANRGFYEPESLYSFNVLGSGLGQHPTLHMSGVETPTGSLGHGLSIGLGLAQGLRLDGKKNKVYVLMGDGELHEGQVWEAAMAAPRWNLDNLVAIVDRNGLSMDGPTEEVTVPLDPLAGKWQSFNWGVREVDGHDVAALVDAFNSVPFAAGRPSVVIAHTTKGKGVECMENKWQWHYGYLPMDACEIAIEALQDSSSNN